MTVDKFLLSRIALCLLAAFLTIGMVGCATSVRDINSSGEAKDATIEAASDPAENQTVATQEDASATESKGKFADNEIGVATQTTSPSATETEHVHIYNSTVISPSCNRQGYTLYSCECGDTYKDDVKDKLSHDYTSCVIAPTTTSGGYTLHTCSICGDEYKDSYTDPLNDSQADSGASDPEPTNPAPSEPEATDPEPSEPEQSEQPEYNEDPGNIDLNDSRNDDYGYCEKCGRHIWTYTDQTGCFTFLEDSVCDCGAFVKAGECHHH